MNDLIFQIIDEDCDRLECDECVMHRELPDYDIGICCREEVKKKIEELLIRGWL